MNAQETSKGVYGISVVEEMTGIGQQNLRLYERRGLLEPDRTPGGTRRYSPDDVLTLKRITLLLDEGLNLAGIRVVLGLEKANSKLSEQLRRLQSLP